MKLGDHLGRENGNPASIEHALAICQAQADDAAARLIEASRKPVIRAQQQELLSLIFGYQFASMTLLSAVYFVATGPAIDD